MTSKSDDKPDAAALIAKRDQLLGEVKALKARLTEAESDRDAWKAKAETAEAALRRFKVDDPLEDLAGGMFGIPTRFAVQLLRDHFAFELGGDGAVTVRDKAGTELPFTAEAIATAAEAVPELAEHLRKAEGPAPGGGSRRPRGTRASAPAKPVTPALGLR